MSAHNNDDLQPGVANLAEKHPGWAVMLLVVQGVFRVITHALSTAVIITLIVAAALVAIAMMYFVPPAEYGKAAEGFSTVIGALGHVLHHGVFSFGGYVLALLVIIAATIVIQIQQHRRRAQDEELRALRNRLEPTRQSSQMSFEELYKRDSK